jgi:hypothetical protein
MVEVLRRPIESALAALIAVVDQALGRLAAPDGHVEGVNDQLGAQVVGHRPATTRRDHTSRTTARYSQPDQVGT